MKAKVLSEYPRPQFIRDSYLSLNGYWDYRISKDESLSDSYDGEILVPFSPETPLSGVNKIVQPDEYLFYHLKIELPKEFNKDKVILHFTAVDQIIDVFINKKLVISHTGGFLPFECDIKPYLNEKENQIDVRVKDVSDTSYHSRGKQRIKRGGIWYTPQSGIYLPVWLEAVNNGYIESIKMTPDIDNQILKISVKSSINNVNLRFLNETINIPTNEEYHLKIDNPHLWSVDDPYLYDLEIFNEVDHVKTYFAMRKFSLIKDDSNHMRLALNNKPIFMKGVLDQGYYQEGFLTPSSDDDYVKDISLIKDLGFNTIRKHIKIESPRFYYHCDRLGVIVWQDFVNGGEKYKFSTISFPLITNRHHNDHNYKKFSRSNVEGRIEALNEFKSTIEYLYNVPSIALWTIFNEGWGQFDSKEIYEELSKLDVTRFFDHASGWHDQGVSDVKSLHVYFKKVKMPKDKKIKGRSVILSECGGFHLKIDGHTFSDKSFGYKRLKDSNELEKTYEKFIKENILNNIDKGLSAFIYTQLSDVEDELNGFITYDREVVKVNKKTIKAINDLVKL